MTIEDRHDGYLHFAHVHTPVHTLIHIHTVHSNLQQPLPHTHHSHRTQDLARSNNENLYQSSDHPQVLDAHQAPPHKDGPNR
jgi:hypothetical protein